MSALRPYIFCGLFPVAARQQKTNPIVILFFDINIDMGALENNKTITFDADMANPQGLFPRLPLT